MEELIGGSHVEYTKDYGKIDYSSVPEGTQSFIPKDRWLILSFKESVLIDAYSPTPSISLATYYLDNWGAIYNPSLPGSGFSPPSGFYTTFIEDDKNPETLKKERKELVQLNDFLIDQIKKQYNAVFCGISFPNILRGVIIGPRTMNLEEYKHMMIYPICKIADFFHNLISLKSNSKPEDLMSFESDYKSTSEEKKLDDFKTDEKTQVEIDYEEKLSKIEKENNDLKILLSNNLKDLEQMIDYCHISHQKLKELELEYSEFKTSKIKEYESKLDEYKTIHNSKEKEKEKERSKNQQIALLKMEVKKYSEKYVILQEKLKISENKLKEQRKLNDEKLEEIATEEQKLVLKISTLIYENAELKERIESDKTDEIKKLQETISELTESRENYKKLNGQFAIKLKENREKLKEFREDIDHLNDLLSKQKSTIEHLKSQNDKLQIINSSILSKYKSSDSIIKTLQFQKEKLESDYAKEQMKFLEAVTQMQTFTKIIEGLNRTNVILNERIEKMNKEPSSKETSSTKSVDPFSDEIMVKLEEVLFENTQLKDDLSESKELIKGFSMRCNELTTKYQTLREEYQTLQQEFEKERIKKQEVIEENFELTKMTEKMSEKILKFKSIVSTLD